MTVRHGPRYRLLGPVAAHDDVGPVRLGGPKQRAVLAVLLLRANRVVPEEQLVDLVWGQSPPPSVRGRLQVHISELRALLGSAAISRPAAGYLIDVPSGELDLQVFDDMVEAAARARADGRPEQAAAHLRRALDLWAGPALGATTAPLVEREGPALAERRLTALEDYFDAELAAGQHGRVTGDLRSAAAEQPFRERIHALLMLALHAGGHNAEALRHYRTTRELLTTELGVEPGPLLRAAHQRILAGGDDAPAVADAVRPAQLPPDLHGFAGRDAALAALDDAAVDDGVLAITGPGGVGKSALAVHWAYGARDRFPDGQLYLDLHGFDAERNPSHPSTGLARLLRALGIGPQAVPSGLDDQVALYRSLLADRRMLVVLDDARDADHVLPLLPPSGLAIVTSRSRLGDLVVRTGARTMALDVLNRDDGLALLARVLGDQRVTAESDAAAELVRRCGGLPLALRIAAANVVARPDGDIAAILTELTEDDPLAGLVVDGARRGAVTSAFAVSYHALADEDARMFRLLALVPGADFTATTAAALADVQPADATRRLRALAAAHLVEPHHGGRYRLHTLIRHYAATRAVADEEPGARDSAWARLVTVTLSTMDAAVASWSAQRAVRLPRDRSPHDDPATVFATPAAAAAWLAEEAANVLAVLRCAARRGPYPAAWQLADAMRVASHWHGLVAEWLDTAEEVLPAAEQAGARPVQALLHLALGQGRFSGAQVDRGIHHLTESLAISRDCGWLECEAAAAAELATRLEWVGRLTEAIDHARHAVALYRRCGDRAGEGIALTSLAAQYRHVGRLDLAEHCARDGLQLSRAEGSPSSIAFGLAVLGGLSVARGRFADAETILTEAADVVAGRGPAVVEVQIWWCLADLHCETGDLDAATREAGHGLDLAERTHTDLLVGGALLVAGRVATMRGLFDAAARDYRRVLEIATREDLRWHRVRALNGLSRLHNRRGEHAMAVDCARQATTLADDGGYRLITADALTALAEAYIRHGDHARAADAADTALAIWRTARHTTGEARTRRVLGELLAVDG